MGQREGEGRRDEGKEELEKSVEHMPCLQNASVGPDTSHSWVSCSRPHYRYGEGLRAPTTEEKESSAGRELTV